MNSSLVEFSSNVTGKARVALESIVRQWDAAAQKWDPNKLASLYTPDALFFGGQPGLYVGTAQIRAYFAIYASVMKSVRFNLFDQHVLEPTKDTYIAQGFGKFRAVLVSGVETESIQRTTLLVIKLGTQWKLAQHHFSAMPT